MSARDELWHNLGIDPDRISRDEFDEYMDAYDRASAAELHHQRAAGLGGAGSTGHGKITGPAGSGEPSA